MSNYYIVNSNNDRDLHSDYLRGLISQNDTNHGVNFDKYLPQKLHLKRILS